MAYIKGSVYPITELEIRAAHPNTSFPYPMAEGNVIDFGYSEVLPSPQPTYSPITQFVREIAPALLSGKYYQAYEIVALSQEQIDANTSAATAAFIAAVTVTTQARLDDFAKTRNYDGILSAASYAVSSHPPFADEGRYCADMRDATWGALYTLMAEVQAGTRPMPSSVEEVMTLLPALVWPT